MAANWLRRTDTLDTLRVNNTILTGTANNNGLTLYQANLQYPALTTSTSVSSNKLSTTTTIGNLNPTPQYSVGAVSTLNIQANNPNQPVSSVMLTINDISQASIATYIIGNNPTGVGVSAAAANRAYRSGYFKTGQVENLENFAFVRSTNAGQAGMAEITGDVNFYFNMQVARNIYTAGSLNVVSSGATVSSLVPTVGGKSFINGIGGGLLGIGTTNPQYTLDVAGAAHISGGITTQQITTGLINVYPPGLTVLAADTNFPYANMSYNSYTPGTSIFYNVKLGTSTPDPTWTFSQTALQVYASNAVQPVGAVSIGANDASGQNLLTMYVIGDGSLEFGGGPNQANRAYRYVYDKLGNIQQVESITFKTGSSGAAGVSETLGDINFTNNMQVGKNIYALGSIVAGQNSATQVGLLGSGTTTLDASGAVIIPFASMTGNGRVMTTYNGAGPRTLPLTVQVAGGSFTIIGDANASLFWMVIYV